MLFKLGDGDVEPRVFKHADVFEREQTTGPDRLRIGPRSRHIDLLLSMASTWTSPCMMLYVLLVPRRGLREPGRYESPIPLTFEEVEQFCVRFSEFLERDGRHHLWIASRDGELLVYDKHQWIYAYGDLAAYESILTANGLRRGTLDLPVPHCHHYHREFDDAEEELMAYWPWQHSPLRPGDD